MRKRHFIKRAFKSALVAALVVAQIPIPQVWASEPSFGSDFRIPIEELESRLPVLEEIERTTLREGAADNLQRLVTDEQLAALQYITLEQRNRGLVGFTNEYALPEDNRPVSVIVVFENNPAPVQMFEAFLEGEALSEAEAEANVDNDHELFRQELGQLFGNQRARTASYRISREYRIALNGVSLTVPANMLSEIADFDSVRVIYPNVQVSVDPIDIVALSDALRNPAGMQPGRETMRADELHALGYRGEGIVVAVLDTGIDYYHPAFEGAFLTLEEAQALNPALTEAHALNGYFFGRNLVDDLYMLPDLLNPEAIRGANDPMETTFEFWQGSGYPRTLPNGVSFYTSHGTHVAGTILGRDTGGDLSILGVAPEARMIAYRVLGPYGSGTMDAIVAGIEYAYLDGADVMNLSLGGADNTPAGWPTTVAVNNIKLANPYVVFVIAAGNSGSNLYTMTAPAAASTAITVANIAEAGYVGATFDLNGSKFDIAFGSTPASWLAFDGELGLASTASERLVADENGAYRIFAMPRTDLTNFYPGPVPGVGNADDFAALVEQYGDGLEGAFVLVRRGYTFASVAEMAYELGIGGIIAINNTDANDASGIPSFEIPYVFVGLGAGLELYELLESPGTIAFTGMEHSPFRLNATSSRGPVFQSFEIKPDLGANGTNVLSAVPAWFVSPGGGDDYSVAYGAATGTSMAAPHVAGAVALMIEYSRANAQQWTSDEIKVRLMNTSIPFENGFYSVFEKGTGYADVLAAIQADVLVTVLYDRVASEFGTPFRYQPFQVTGTGSFSFGGQEVTDELVAFYRSLSAVITNEGNAARTFIISHSYNYGPRETRNPSYMDLSFSATTLTVPAGGEALFTATLEVLEDAPAGLFEGHVYVTDAASGELIARLPFAAVRYEVEPLFSGLYLYRPVISTSPERVNELSASLGLILTPYTGLGFNTWIVRDVEGINETNWRTPEFIDSVIGLSGQNILHDSGLIEGQVYRGRIFDGWYYPLDGEELQLFEEGEGRYFLALEMFRQIGSDEWRWEKDVLLPFEVDNTPPVLAIDDLETIANENGETTYLFTAETLDPIVVTGNVYDLWMEQAAANGITFDIWRNNSQVDNDFLAVWVNVGRNTSFLVEVDEDGNFEIPLGNIHEALPLEVRVTAIDNWSLIPEIEAFLGTQDLRFYTGDGNWFFNLEGGLVYADESLHNEIRQGVPWGFWPDPLFDFHMWSGLNLTEFTFTVDGDFEAIERDPNRPSAIFNYSDNVGVDVFREMSAVEAGLYHPMESVVVDFGRIMENLGRVGDDAMVSFQWEHESSNLVRFGRFAQTLRYMGVNPYDSATHTYTLANPNDYHPLNLMRNALDWEGNPVFDGMEALRWLSGYWTFTVSLEWYDREASAQYVGHAQVVKVYETRSENPQFLQIDHLPTGGLLWNEADFPEIIYVGFDAFFHEFNFLPQVEYDQMIFAFLPESAPVLNLLNILGDGFIAHYWLPGYAFPLHLHFPDMEAHFLNQSVFEQPYRLYAWTLVDGEWLFADYSPSIEFRSLASIDIPIEQLMELIERIEAENLVEEDWHWYSWMALEATLYAARNLVARYQLYGYAHTEDLIYTYRRLFSAFSQMELAPFDSNRFIDLVNEVSVLELKEADFTPESWEPFQWIYELSVAFLYYYQRDIGIAIEGTSSPTRPTTPEDGFVWDYNIVELYYYLRYRFENLERIGGDGADYPYEDDPIEEDPAEDGDELLESALIALTALIEVALNLNEEEFTSETWTSLLEAREAALEVLGADDSRTILQAIERLAAAIHDLEALEPEYNASVLEAALSALQALVEFASDLEEAMFTVETWEALVSALETAKEALYFETLEAVIYALDGLARALNGLERYVPENEDGDDVYGLTPEIDPDPEIEQGLANLQQAISAVLAMNLLETDFTEASWSEFSYALNVATFVLENGYSLFIIEEAILNLERAVNNLEFVYEEEDAKHEEDDSKYEEDDSKHEEDGSKYEEDDSKYEEDDSKQDDESKDGDDTNGVKRPSRPVRPGRPTRPVARPETPSRPGISNRPPAQEQRPEVDLPATGQAASIALPAGFALLAAATATTKIKKK